MPPIPKPNTTTMSSLDVKVEPKNLVQEDLTTYSTGLIDEVHQSWHGQQEVLLCGSLGGPTVTPLYDVIKCEPEVIQGLDDLLPLSDYRVSSNGHEITEADSHIDNEACMGYNENKENGTPTEEEQTIQCDIRYPNTRRRELQNKYMVDHTNDNMTNGRNILTNLNVLSSSNSFLCDRCQYRSCKRRELVEHIKGHNSKTEHECDRYGMPLAKNCNSGDKKTNDVDASFKCDLCDYMTKRKSSMVNHIAIHSNIKKFSTNNKTSLKKNIKIHSTEPNSCPICGHKLTAKSQLRKHILSHEGAAPLKCNICGIVFRRISSLKQHALGHIASLQYNPKTERKTESKRFKCRKCKFSSRSIKGLNIHGSVHALFRCAQCDYTAKDKKLLEHHMCTVHSEKISNRKNVSNKTVFSTIKHSESKRFKCAICSYSSNRNQDLRRHQSVHSTIKSYQCAQCDYETKRKDMLISHMVVHSKYKPYICDACGFAFRWKSAHTRHMATHNKGKVYKCSDCKFVCNRKDYLRQHKLIHNSVKPFKCDICKAIYCDKDTLRKHITRKHLSAK